MSAALLAAAAVGNQEFAPERQQYGMDREFEGCRPMTAPAAKRPDVRLQFSNARAFDPADAACSSNYWSDPPSAGTPDSPSQPAERTISKTLLISLPVAELGASTAFSKALGFSQNPNFSDEDGSAMVWSEAIQVMLVTHAKWRTFTQRPFPPVGSCGMMLSLALGSRAAVGAMSVAAAARGGQAGVNPMEDHGFMYTRDLADPDGHMWAALRMDPAAMPMATT